MTAHRPEGDAFPAHGRVEVHPHGRVIYFEATGPFNAEAVAMMRKAYTPIMASMAADGPFGHISTFHESMLATPEALEAFAAPLESWRKSDILPTVNAYVVASDVEGRGQMMPIFAKVFDGFSPFRDFERFDEAEAWVRQKLAAAG